MYTCICPILLFILLSACTSAPVVNNIPADLNDKISGADILGYPVLDAELPDNDLFGLTPEMKQFAEDAVKSGSNSVLRSELLHKALISPAIIGGLGVSYSAFTTGTAREVFESTSANCLGYTLLYVALARHVGLNAQVNQVMIPPTWDMNSDSSYFLIRHVNAKVAIRKVRWQLVRERSSIADVSDVIVDLEIRRFRPTYAQKILDMQSVEALFYNNRAMEYASIGDDKNAFIYLRRALKAKPDESSIWSNMGSFYRRSGKVVVAESLYKHALSLEANNPTVLSNLAALYQQTGDLVEAENYRKRVQHYRDSNPYYLYQKATRAKEDGDIPGAISFINRALKKETKDDRLYLLASELYSLSGDADRARKLRKKSEALLKEI